MNLIVSVCVRQLIVCSCVCVCVFSARQAVTCSYQVLWESAEATWGPTVKCDSPPPAFTGL